MTSAPSSASLPRAPLSVFFWSLKKCAPVAAVTAVLMILIQPALLLLLGLSWLRTKTIFTGAAAAGNFEPVYLTTQVCTLLVCCSAISRASAPSTCSTACPSPAPGCSRANTPRGSF